MSDKHYMSKEDAERIQSTQAKGGGNMGSDGFTARAQSAGDRNVNAGYGQKTDGQGKSGVGSGNTGNKK